VERAGHQPRLDLMVVPRHPPCGRLERQETYAQDMHRNSQHADEDQKCSEKHTVFFEGVAYNVLQSKQHIVKSHAGQTDECTESRLAVAL
jgi:hypothetical protein